MAVSTIPNSGPTAGYHSVPFADYFTRSDGVSDAPNGRISVDNATVTIYAELGSVSVSGAKELGTLSKYYPSAIGISVIASVGASTDRGEPVRISIRTDGKVIVYGTLSYSSTLRFTATYATANVI